LVHRDDRATKYEQIGWLTASLGGGV